MSIKIVVTEYPSPLVHTTSEKRLLKIVAKALEAGDFVTSASGKSLAAAVEWCEVNGRPYQIDAIPGAGYSLKLTDREELK